MVVAHFHAVFTGKAVSCKKGEKTVAVFTLKKKEKKFNYLWHLI